MSFKKFAPINLILLVLFASACSLAPAPAATQSPVDPPDPGPIVSTLPAATETSMAEPLATNTPDTQVIITAATGSLAIRRGPGTAYNVIGFLQDGQSAVASARDASNGWLYIPLPGAPSVYGWVSAGTQYSTLQGDIALLEVMTVAAAQPITIRNCTYHPMLITPLNTILSPQNETPGNLTTVIPGEYTSYDQSVSNTQVLVMNLEEGDWVDITTDGLGNTYACP